MKVAKKAEEREAAKRIRRIEAEGDEVTFGRLKINCGKR